jgi:hypothetical protein
VAARSILFLLAGCGSTGVLLVGVEDAAFIASDRIGNWGSILRVELRLENTGDSPVHVFTDQLQVVAEGGNRGTVREFRDRYRIQQARTEDAARRRDFADMFAGVGILADQLRELVQAEIEILPGQTLKRTLPFLLKQNTSDTRFSLDITYHDDATDRITRLNLPLKAK